MRADPFPPEELTENAFLGGKVRLMQPREGYRAGIDPVLLAAAVPARAGQHVLELGCGGGVGLLCLAARVPGLRLAGIERQAGYADLARRNAALNGADMAVEDGDIAAMPRSIRAQQFDHVFANPPYFDPATRSAARDTGREAGLAGDTPLDGWVGAAARRVKQGGSVTMIHRAEALPILLAAFNDHLGSLVAQPLAPRAGRAARLVIVRGEKSGRAAFRLNPALILHDGDTHARDGDDFTARIRGILRDGEPLDL